MPTVLIIIVTWNKPKDVRQLLTFLKVMDYPPESCEIVVVDNAGQDGTADMVAENFPDVRLIRNDTNLGGSGGFNSRFPPKGLWKTNDCQSCTTGGRGLRMAEMADLREQVRMANLIRTDTLLQGPLRKSLDRERAMPGRFLS
ncbi:MAG: hypothetical protein CSA23_02715 [Deltaproteobacteria bacterium]|nr:MAG: hypothetical protein CSA23_02715 [Deltaproteobacteria bacterium]